MKENKQLAARFGVTIALAALVGTSAFAESRHQNETSSVSAARDRVRRERPADSRRGDVSQNRRSERPAATVDRRESSPRRSERPATVDRNRDSSPRRDDTRMSGRNRDGATSNDRNRDNGRIDRNRDRGRRDQSEAYRDRSRGYSRDNNRNNDHRYGSRHYGNRQPYYHRGRISSVHRHGSGYRVFIHGSRYPFFIPLSHYHRDRFRVGLFINLGGYYNPLGYYDYYDYGRYDSRYYDRRTRGEIRGTVESVDYRRNTFVIRNEATDSFVTVIDRERREDIRPGDYVELYGEWSSRSGVFEARDVDVLDYRDYRD